MKAIGTIIGLGLGIIDLIGIVGGFAISLGHGVGALMVPPYGLFLGFITLLG